MIHTHSNAQYVIYAVVRFYETKCTLHLVRILQDEMVGEPHPPRTCAPVRTANLALKLTDSKLAVWSSEIKIDSTCR